MKKITLILGFLFATFALFSQSINANFKTDSEGWTSHQTTVEWANLFAPMNDRGGIRFFGKQDTVEILFLFIQKELTELLPNTNYRITFNMNWLAWLDTLASPIFVKVGAMNSETRAEQEIEDTISFTVEKEDEVLIIDSVFTRIAIQDFFESGELGQDGRDFTVVGQLTPNEYGYAFMKNINNFDNAFYVNTDDEGRLFLMIGVETENDKIENVFLNTLRILLHEIGEVQEHSDEEIKYIEIGECERDELFEEIIITTEN
ncbi:MAG: hypothetical protein FWC98_02130 [Bacteroidales bacterium]|nr:hypothetical protein [Bacteroidales bacterium]